MKIVSLMFVSLLAAAPAFAQDAVATLSTSGDVQVSAGGDFSAAASGTSVQAGTRVMVGEGASAVVRYANNCEVTYTRPGVYTVAATCTPVGGRTGTDVAGAGAIAAGVAVGALLLNNMDEVEAPPFSR